MKRLMMICAVALVFAGCGDPDNSSGGPAESFLFDRFGVEPKGGRHTLTVSRNPVAGGTVTVNGSTTTGTTTHNNGVSVTVVAHPNQGYTFAGWQGASSSTNTSITVTMSGNRSLTANFNLTSTWQQGYSCFVAQGTCTPITNQGTWDACAAGNRVLSTSAQCQSTVTYTVTWNANGGTPVPTQTTVLHGGSITTPATMTRTGHTFGGWFTNSSFTGSAVSFPITNVTANTTLWARWTPITHTLTVNRNPTAGGTVTVNGATYTNPTTHNANASVTVVATAVSGYRFTGWSGASTSTNNSITITMSGNMTLTANFALEIVYGSFTDTRDGKSYKTVLMPDGKTWMAENLNFATSSGSWCYNNSPDSCAKYGRLYDWATAMNIATSFNNNNWSGNATNHQGICPSDWRLPTRQDWRDLATAAGGSVAGTRLKAGQPAWNGTDDFGFSALPGGDGWHGSFNGLGDWGNWWSATEYGADFAWFVGMNTGRTDVYELWDYKLSGLSVRCLRD